MAKLTLLTGSVVAYAYAVETYVAWWSGSPFETATFLRERPFGQYAVIFWTMIACNVCLPQALWARRVRQSEVMLFVLSLLINVGMWAERFHIIVSSLDRDFVVSSWSSYAPSPVDWTILFGTLSFFGFLFLLFLRFIPFIPIAELKELGAEAHHG
jgi:molybdopterin-containing oxidoreductase family membrane subunit